MFKSVVVLSAAVVAFGLPASAATVNPSGQVSVNQGAGFHTVKGAAQVNPGDKVMVASGGSATVVYENGCSLTLDAGVHVVPPVSACQAGAGSLANPTTIVIGAGVIGGGIAAGVLLSGGNKHKSP